jgi:predicted ATPase/DNA-binding SARP family transcriptional activator
MRIGLLGELEVVDDAGAAITLSGAKLRALLSLLALHAGRAVPAEQLVESLWGDDAPSGVKNSLQGLVSKLRRTFEIPMRGSGYVLDVDPDVVDVHRFERLVTEARAADDPTIALARYADADALWRGDALVELAYDDGVSPTITRLTELRLAALEERFAITLARGGHQAAISELEALVALHPLRERLRALLMTALYRAGRQADALRAFQDGREILADELGLDPSPELRALEAAILAQDPALAAPATDDVRPVSGRRSLPAPLTPLVGRTEELDALTVLLGELRLVTLVGPGGVGKTRLALEAGAARADALEHGGCLVELAPVGDPADVRTAIADALDVPDPDRLVELLGDRELLLVLDNCEHVITAAAAAAEELLRACPRLRLLATSREGLRVNGEAIWPVPPLGSADAVELFVARARAAGAAVDDVAVIQDICARLDGLPLAIELAAARTRAFPVQQLASRLQDRFRLLTGGSRTALPRQQTLRAVVDWSYELLFEDEQRVFERLSVLPGGCDLATAQVVCADTDLTADDIEDVVQALVEKSLVVPVATEDALRVTQLQTLAQYGREKLAERGDAERTRDAMAAHFASLCAGSAHAFTGDEQRTWLRTIDRERENLRAALEWAVDRGDAETALVIASGASWPHWLAGTVAEGLRWLDAAFAVDGEVSDSARAHALTGRGLLRFQSGVREGVDDDLGAALAIFRELGDTAAQAWTYSFWAEVAAARGDVDEGRRRRRELLAFYESQPDDDFTHAARAYSRAKLGQLDGDLAASEHWYREATEHLTRIDRPSMRAMCLGMVAEFEERAGDFHAATVALDEAVRLCDDLGLVGIMGAMQARLGWTLLQEGEVARAEDVYLRALEQARRLSNTQVMMLSSVGLAALHRRNGRDHDAVAAATEALDLHGRIGPRRMANRISAHADMAAGAAVACVVLAVVAAEAGDAPGATVLLQRADELRARAGVVVPAFQVDDLERARSLVSAPAQS